MADYSRSTRTVAIDQLDAPLLDAIKALLHRHELDIVLLDAIGAAVTESTPTKKRWFGRRRRPYTTGIVLTPTWLLWASDASGTPVASMCRLTDADVRRFRSDLADDVGIEVTGFLDPSASTRSTAFVPVDAGRAGNEFAQLVLDTASSARG